MRTSPVHPVLFAGYAVLYLYSVNTGEIVGFKQIVPALVVALGAACALLLIGALAFRSWSKGALVATLIVVLIGSFGHVWRIFASGDPASSEGGDTWLLVLWGVVGLVGLLVIARTKSNVTTLTKALNAMGLVLATIALTTILWGENTASSAGVVDDRTITTDVASPERPPDIYLLVFDRYAGEDVLLDTYQFDNLPFLKSLEGRGFFVAHQSHANYPNTAHSLAASLNLDYLDSLRANEGGVVDDWAPVYSMVSDHEVGRFLESQGYRHIQIPSWWEPTRESSTADEILLYDPLSEFSRVMLNTTVIPSIAIRLGLEEAAPDPRRVEWRRVTYQLDQIANVDRGEDPVFVFAHLLLPHHPYVFDADGSYQTEEQEEALSRVDRYVEQLRFTNSAIEQLVDRLLQGPREDHPIILLQSDEGPAPLPNPDAPPPPGEHTPYWNTYSDDQLKQKFGILNTFYFPNGQTSDLYNDISPVNNFRVLLNQYFGLDLTVLDDRSYVWSDRAHLYDFTDVTERLN